MRFFSSAHRAVRFERSKASSPAKSIVEPLESRQLLSASADAYINSAGVLVVTGTDAADTITLTTQPMPGGQPTQIHIVATNLEAYLTASAVKSILVNAGKGSDVVNTSGVNKPAVLHGGAGDDTLTTGGATDYLYGEDGNDQLYGHDGIDYLYGGSGADQLYGQNGNDQLDGGTGADFISGGNGFDLVNYADRSAALRLLLDNVANDGAAGENDFLASDLEELIGGSGNDLLVGNNAANLLVGGAGDDVLDGGGGNDQLDAGLGHDRLYGGAGDDTLNAFGDNTSDYLDGGTGRDTGFGSKLDAFYSVEVKYTTNG